MNVIQGVSWQAVFRSCFLTDVDQTIPVQCVCSITPHTLHCVDSFCFNLIPLLILYKNVGSRSANICILIINRMLFEQRISYSFVSFLFDRLIRSYTERIKFCLAGSKRTFGLVKGSSVAVLVDTSDVNTGFGRLSTFKESLLVRTLFFSYRTLKLHIYQFTKRT